MEAYKFEVTVLENGIIQIPEIAKFASRQVEIFIVVRPSVKIKTKLGTETEQTIENFLSRWQGFLKGFNPDELKMQYLQEKYG